MAVERGQRIFLQPIDEYSGVQLDLEDGEVTVTYTDGRTENHKVKSVTMIPKKMSMHIDRDGKMTAYGEIMGRRVNRDEDNQRRSDT